MPNNIDDLSSTQTALVNQTLSIANLETLHHQTSEYIKQAKSSNTWKAYKTDWQDFLNWCNKHKQSSLPASPSTVAMYLTNRASTHKTSSLQRRIASIAQMHIGNKLSDPTKSPEVRECWRGIRRSKGIAQTQKAPLLVDNVKEIIRLIPKTLIGQRDKALLLVGFTSAFRRSEIVALNVEDLEFTKQGLIIILRKSKTDQLGEGRKVGLPHSRDSKQCPVVSLKKWLEVAAIKQGAIFCGVNRHSQLLPGRLTDRQVANTVKKYCEQIGLDPTLFSGHSLRSGLATSAAIAGASERQIMQQTGHKNSAMVRRYIRDAEVFRDNVVSKIGL
jgi:site-specific recombinase XerD